MRMRAKVSLRRAIKKWKLDSFLDAHEEMAVRSISIFLIEPEVLIIKHFLNSSNYSY